MRINIHGASGESAILQILAILKHHWLTIDIERDLRPSQLAQQGPQALAEKLAEPLRRNGDLGYAEPTNMNDMFVFPIVITTTTEVNISVAQWIQTRTKSCSLLLTNLNSHNHYFSL